ncbi:MAG: YdeI/OmpD-associated family protein [Bacteroidetes bacterium]|nr:YdeI/OmpD-associated family protein [Bacteroidota bacterium]
MNPKVDFFFAKAKKWKTEFEKLRTILLDCELTEELKWGVPCYTYQDHNVALIHGFKDYCAILFHNGVLLKDKSKLLIQQTPNVQVARQLRFTDIREIIDRESLIKAYLHEAIALEKSGAKPEMKKVSDFEVPDEFKTLLDKNKNIKTAFSALTPGRQRGYLLYFAQAKLEKTRVARIEKYISKILEGKGLDD